jgi:hypothetical protein
LCFLIPRKTLRLAGQEHGRGIPLATLIAVLVDPSQPFVEAATKDALTAGRVLGLQIHIAEASSERDINAGFEAFAQVGAGRLVICPGSSTSAGAVKSPRWRSATRCPPFSTVASSLRPAV